MKYNNPKPIPFEDMDVEILCQYCEKTDYGNEAYYHTPHGIESCEGRWCEEAYDAYLEDFYNAQPDTEDEEFFGQHMADKEFYQEYGFPKEIASGVFNLSDNDKNFLKTFGTDGVIKYLNDIENNTVNIKNHSEESLPNLEPISPMEEFFNKYNIK